MNRARTLVAAFAMASVLALVAAGCGSSGGSESSDKGSGDTATTASGTGSGSSDAPVALEGTVNAKGSKDISGDGSEAKLDMELDDNYFNPTYVKAAPGQTVKVELENEGDNPHTFTLDGGETNEVKPGDKAEVTVTVPDDGFLRFSCDFHGSMGMQGAFYTEAASGASSGSGSSSGSTTTTADSSGGDSGY